jgi:hypothetical protein
MSSKSSRHSGVRIRRDKLKNVIISRFSKPYLMGSDLTTRFTAFLRKILRKNLDKMKDVKREARESGETNT